MMYCGKFLENFEGFEDGSVGFLLGQTDILTSNVFL